MTHDFRVQAWSAARARELPGTEQTHQPRGDWDLWKVGGKVYMLQTEMPGEPVVILKADPDDAESLRDAYAQITAGYHMDKRHWITLHPGEHLERRLVNELVTESYLRVLAGLPQSRRPAEADGLRLSAQQGSATGAGVDFHTGAGPGAARCQR